MPRATHKTRWFARPSSGSSKIIGEALNRLGVSCVAAGHETGRREQNCYAAIK